MTQEIESRASDESLLWFMLQRDQGEEETDCIAAMELVEAVSAFLGNWISPLTAAVRVESCDPANYYSEDDESPPRHPAWFLRRRQLDSRLFIRPSWIDSLERQAATISGSEISALVEEALAQNPPREGLEVALVELLIPAVEIALPEEVEIKLIVGRTQISPILVRGPRGWLAQGPDYNFMGPPASLRAYNQHGVTKFVVEFFWGFWGDHPAGLAQVHAAVERVFARARGWRVGEGNLPKR